MCVFHASWGGCTSFISHRLCPLMAFWGFTKLFCWGVYWIVNISANQDEPLSFTMTTTWHQMTFCGQVWPSTILHCPVLLQPQPVFIRIGVSAVYCCCHGSLICRTIQSQQHGTTEDGKGDNNSGYLLPISGSTISLTAPTWIPGISSDFLALGALSNCSLVKLRKWGMLIAEGLINCQCWQQQKIHLHFW